MGLNADEVDVAVLGAGLTGLTAAHELAKKGKKILVLEKENKAGGLLASVKRKNYTIEKYYHHIFQRDKYFLGLADELGLGIAWIPTSTAFRSDAGFSEFSKPSDLLAFASLNLMEKLKFLNLMLNIFFTKNYAEISAKEFIEKYGCPELFEKFFKPMLAGKFGDNLNEVSAEWFAERIKIRGNRTRKGEILGYVDGGFQKLIDSLLDKIGREKIITNSRIKKIERKNNVFEIFLEREKILAKKIISTIPLDSLFRIIEFPYEYRANLGNLKYQGAVCVLLGLKKKITDFYWTNITYKNSFGGIIEHTNFIDFGKYGEHLVYLASYPSLDSEIWAFGNNDIFDIYFADLQKIAPELKEDDVNWCCVSKAKNAGLVYSTNTKLFMPQQETPIQNLYIGGMFNSYPERSLNLAVKIGKELAEKCSA